MVFLVRRLSRFLVLRALLLRARYVPKRGILGAGPDKTVFLASATRQPCACSVVGACWTGHLVTVSGMGMQGPACFNARLGRHALTHMQSWSCNLYRELASSRWTSWAAGNKQGPNMIDQFVLRSVLLVCSRENMLIRSCKLCYF